MPMKWNAEADARLLVAILDAFKLSFSKDVMEKINQTMGPECKGQAVSQRLVFLRKRAAGLTMGKENGTPGKSSVTPKTKRNTSKSKNIFTDDDDEIPETPVKQRKSPRKGIKRSYTEDSDSEENKGHDDGDADPFLKKVKTEPEDEPEGYSTAKSFGDFDGLGGEI